MTDVFDIPPFLIRLPGPMPPDARSKPVHLLIAEERGGLQARSDELRAMQAEADKRKARKRIATLKDEHPGQRYDTLLREWVPDDTPMPVKDYRAACRYSSRYKGKQPPKCEGPCVVCADKWKLAQAEKGSDNGTKVTRRRGRTGKAARPSKARVRRARKAARA